MRTTDLANSQPLDSLDTRVGITEFNIEALNSTGKTSAAYPEWYTWLRGQQTLQPYKKHGVDILALLELDENPSIKQVERITYSDIYDLFKEYVELSNKHRRNKNFYWTLGLLNELISVYIQTTQ